MGGASTSAIKTAEIFKINFLKKYFWLNRCAKFGEIRTRITKKNGKKLLFRTNFARGAVSHTVRASITALEILYEKKRVT